MEEIWKDIKGYEGLYKISNYGRVESLPKNRYGSKKSIILKPFLDKDGYERVCLCYNNKRKYKHVHIIVAEHFVPNPELLPIVHHKNANKRCNFVGNLQWSTHQYNSEKGNGKYVSQFSIDGIFMKEYTSIKNASKETGVNYYSISDCCRGKNKTAGGYRWVFSNYIFSK